VPVECYVDAARGEIAVANLGNDSVTVHARTASGDATPLRTIVGPSTSLRLPTSVRLDAVRDEVFVVNVGAFRDLAPPFRRFRRAAD
jgi:hypothetical protein